MFGKHRLSARKKPTGRSAAGTKYVLADGRFANTSLWAEGQRRWVWLKGCVERADQADALERLVRGLDDVEAVNNELVVKKR